MDITSLIFVALAVAWAVYLVPKALQSADEGAVSHSVERFSSALRVLSRNEPAGASASADAATSTGTPADAPVGASVAPAARVRRPSAAQIRARREAARRAAQRRRRVLVTLLVLNVAVAVTAAFGVVGWAWQAAPATLLVAWLVTCRLMVRSEQAAHTQAPVRVRIPRVLDDAPVAASPADQDASGEAPESVTVDRNEQGFDEVGSDADTSTIEAVREDLWSPVPITLPTYVTKDAATRRTVRTIDLSAPGVTTSGRTAEDSAIAREADEAERQSKLAALARSIRKSS
ncbi:hypothetical protein GCM10011584_00400 [Nocardioides phosphati]|uniref:Uncharacterized protein n=1 Tax=Nocardioides phosphati TaxID=1867775 RepID=A0ABQ2N480_9ACTN|nr:hypothetical protein [Nocardioides phosphati]GGO83964.1 hypothetical protein GCM10011584_00400 [Nocardioides phosphati]